MSLRLPFFRLVKDGTTLPSSEYTKRGRTGSTTVTGIADPARIVRLFGDGATIVLQALHRYWFPLAHLARELEIELGHPIQVNAYITPPGARGLAVHEDTHDVFVLQAFGHKAWDVYERPARTEGASSGDRAGPTMSVDLRAGESLYLPKGTPHGARSQESLSGHITVGILAATWADLLGTVFERLRREPQFEEPLPAGVHRDIDTLASGLAERLEEAGRWLDKVDPRTAAAEAVHRFLTTRPPRLKGLLTDMARVDAIDDASMIGRRPGSICELFRVGGRLHAMLGDRELTMPDWLEPAMERIRASGRLRVGDLATDVPDPSSRLVLVNRLLREGLLEVVE